jgi:hypothetical protein
MEHGFARIMRMIADKEVFKGKKKVEIRAGQHRMKRTGIPFHSFFIRGNPRSIFF